MLVNSLEMLKKAKDNKKAIFHFNINNLEWTKYILEECNDLNTSVILGVSESAIKYMGGYHVVYSMVVNLIKDLKIKIDVCLHLDHGSSFDSCKEAIDAGFTSVMIDKSKETFENNVLETKKVVSYAHLNNVMVEAELGLINSINNISNNYDIDESSYIDFVEQTNIDSLAPAVGTVHGIYKGTLNIDYDLIKYLYDTINIPLVLHGGSGLSNDILKRCIESGISKININSDIQQAWSISVKNYLNNNKNEIDPRKIIGSGSTAIKEVVKEKININD